MGCWRGWRCERATLVVCVVLCVEGGGVVQSACMHALNAPSPPPTHPPPPRLTRHPLTYPPLTRPPGLCARKQPSSLSVLASLPSLVVLSISDGWLPALPPQVASLSTLRVRRGGGGEMGGRGSRGGGGEVARREGGGATLGPRQPTAPHVFACRCCTWRIMNGACCRKGPTSRASGL